MYMAKRDGKGSYRHVRACDARRASSSGSSCAPTSQRAIDDDQFELHYQPVVRLDEGAVSGVEALLRWQHPDAG